MKFKGMIRDSSFLQSYILFKLTIYFLLNNKIMTTTKIYLIYYFLILKTGN